MADKNIEILNEIINQITLYVPLLIIISGTIGSLCNVITFTSRQLRFSSCAFYFLCSTIFDLLYLLFGGITRLMIDHFSNMLLNRSVLLCKCRTYLVVVLPSLSTIFIMLASMDRCLSTSTSRKWRNLSRINIAWCVAIITFLVSVFSTSHILFLFELRAKDVNSNTYICGPHDDIYKRFITICFFFISPFITYTIMLICTMTTLIRIRTSRYRMGFLDNRRRKSIHRNIDRNLITLLFVQVGVGILLTFLRCGFLVYSISTINIKKNIYRITMEAFFDKISLVIYYMNFAKSFPVNTLTSPLFRRVFRQRIINLIR